MPTLIGVADEREPAGDLLLELQAATDAAKIVVIAIAAIPERRISLSSPRRQGACDCLSYKQSNRRLVKQLGVYALLMEFRDIERRPVVQQVAEQLREAVIDAVNRSLQFPGETSLSEALAVSRPTLREALRILEAEGLIARDARTSVVRPDARVPAMSRPLRSALTVLTKTEQTSLAEIMDLRVAIEEHAVRRAAQVATPDDLRLLEEALDEQRRAAAAGEEVDTAGFRFRAAMVKASHNEAFFLVFLAAREAAADLLEHAAALARERYGRPSQPYEPDRAGARRQIVTNEAILEAIRQGRGSDAAALSNADMAAIFAPLITPTEESSIPESR